MKGPRLELNITSWNCERLTRYIAPKPAQLQLGESALARPPATLAHIFESFGLPHVVCLQEVRLRARDRKAVEHAAHAVPGYLGNFHLCDDAHNAKSSGGKHYGVGTYVRWGLPACTFRTLPWDHEGRIIIADIDDLNLTLVNWYNVNGTDRPYYDPQTGEPQGNRHEFKQRSQQGLLDALRTLPKGRNLIVIGDFNVTPTARDISPRLRTGAPFVAARTFMRETFAKELDLVDIYRTLHPEARQYTWFNRVVPTGVLDAARVDYALVSRTLVPHVVEACIDETLAARFASDHAPFYLRVTL
jgi:exodeoxyribonuclease III